MELTRTRFSKLLRILATAAVVVLIAAYAGYRSLSYMRGPVIQIFQPVNGSTISTTTVTIMGQALRVNSLSLNDFPIQIDEEGNFKQTLIVFPGVNVMSLYATDQFKRSAREEIRIFGVK